MEETEKKVEETSQEEASESTATESTESSTEETVAADATGQEEAVNAPDESHSEKEAE